MRYCAIRDLNCRWYIIEASKRGAFITLDFKCKDKDDYTEFELEFGSCRIAGPHSLTFTDPLEFEKPLA